MNKRIRRALTPGSQLFFIVMILFALVTVYFVPLLAAAEGAVIMIIYGVYLHMTVVRRKEVVRYIEQITMNVDTATKDSVVNFPLPTVIIRMDTGEILWCNTKFYEITGDREHLFEISIKDVVPDFDLHWLLEGKTEYPSEIALKGRIFTVFGNVVRSGAKDAGGYLGSVYWLDTTELSYLRSEALLSRTAVAIITMDNYDEVLKNSTDTARSGILAALDEKVSAWAEHTQGILRKYDRDKYLFLFQERFLQGLADGRFSVLEAARGLQGSAGIPVTLSIGIGRDGLTLRERLASAHLATEMALSRGGDQAVIKNNSTFDFYGGVSKEVEKRTKVKSRIMASALQTLIGDSSLVLIMGHRGSDIDCVGSAAGVVCAARKAGVPARIVIDEVTAAARGIVAQLRQTPEYAHVFTDTQGALLEADSASLLVVVDCTRPEIVESKELLQSINRVAVIDHHRRAATYIDKAALNFHEPYASSASELICELLQYICEPGDLTRSEANALLAGIVLDTKNFTLHTGVRTFEAAAFLRGAGADTVQVKKLFQTDLPTSIARYSIIRNARMVGKDIAVSVTEEPVDRTVAAQAADELLAISGILASFVLFSDGDEAVVSARSMGEVNVQIICERLGGGGHQAMAGAQMPHTDLREATTRLIRAIEIYQEESR
ncbi:MAG: DHH family phosphoesterase [Oscillospiraceae bacterium]|nr:DHH family phosphoesterase [Oscillospiraceae bacterium]